MISSSTILENEMLSLSLLECIKIEDEEYRKHIQHLFYNTFARYLITQSQHETTSSINNKNIL